VFGVPVLDSVQRLRIRLRAHTVGAGSGMSKELIYPQLLVGMAADRITPHQTRSGTREIEDVQVHNDLQF